MSLNVEISNRDATTTCISVGGKLDTTTSPEFEEWLNPVLRSDASVLVLDLANLSYISSAGLRCVFKARKGMESKGGSLLLVNVQPPVQKVFDLVKALPSQSVFKSVADLDQYLDYMQRKAVDS